MDGSSENITTRSMLKRILETEPVRTAVRNPSKRRSPQPSTSHAAQDENSFSPSVHLRSKMKERVRLSLRRSGLNSPVLKRKTLSAQKRPLPLMKDLDDITPRTLLKNIIQNNSEVSLVVSQRPRAAAADDGRPESSLTAPLRSVGDVSLSLPDLQDSGHLTILRKNARRKPRVSEFELEVDGRLPKHTDDETVSLDSFASSSSLVGSNAFSRPFKTKLERLAAADGTSWGGLLRRHNKVRLVSLGDFEQGVENKYQLLKGSQECFIQPAEDNESNASSNDPALMNTQLYARSLQMDSKATKSEDRKQREASKLLISTPNARKQVNAELLKIETRKLNAKDHPAEENVIKDFKGGHEKVIEDRYIEGDSEDDGEDEAGSHISRELMDDSSEDVAEGYVSGDDEAEGHVSGDDEAEGHVSGDDEAESHISGDDEAEGHASGEDEAESHISGEDEAEGHVSGDDEAEGHVSGDDEAESHVSGEDEAESHISGDDEAEGHASGEDEAESHVSGEDEAESHASGDDEAEGHASGDDEAEGHVSGDDEAESHVSGDDEAEGHVSGDDEAESHVSGEDEAERHISGDDEAEGHVSGDDEAEGHVLGEVLNNGSDEESDGHVSGDVNSGSEDEADGRLSGEVEDDDDVQVEGEVADYVMDEESIVQPTKSSLKHSNRQSASVADYSLVEQRARPSTGPSDGNMKPAESIHLQTVIVSRPEEGSEASADESLDLAFARGAPIKENNQLIFPDLPETPPYIKNARFIYKDKPAVTRKKIQRTKSTKPKKPRSSLGGSQVRQLFTHHAQMRVSKDAVACAEECVEKYMDQLASDLSAFTAHANRKTITLADMELLLKRQRLMTDTTSLNVLIEKYLPMDCRRLLIPCALSGNQVFPKNTASTRK